MTLARACLQFCLGGILTAAGGSAWSAPVAGGSIALQAADMEPGRRTELTGQWLYKPGYLVTDSEKPETSITETMEKGRAFAETADSASAGYVPVPVPHILSRIHWWLDDSEDFKKDETERLKKLGFDADRTEDGWYRLEVDVPQLPNGRQLWVEFDGVAMLCEVFWNGKRLGEHAGMFSRFEFDVTPHVKPGKNVLALFVSMEKIEQDAMSMGEAVTVNLTASKVKTMSKAMFGPLAPGFANREYDVHGIWQPVRLAVRGPGKLHDVWFIPSLDGAKVQVETKAAAAPSSQPATLHARWTDPATGNLFAETGPVGAELGTTVSITTMTLAGVAPKLWTPADPNLYLLDVTLTSADGTLLDRATRRVGFRTFETRGNKLLLNGHPYWLRGANHLPYGKNPTDPALARVLIQQMHDNNQRVTRTHCTPWNTAWLDAADDIGLGVSIEGMRPWAFAGKIGATPADLFAHWKMENEDVIRRARNHPSVLIWTVGNEMLIRDHENVEKWGQLSEVVKQTREIDPYRPVVKSSSYERDLESYNKIVKPNGFDDGDIDDVHSYRGWYADSPFITKSDFTTTESRPWTRPLIGQEMSTGYPNLDNGLPTARYTENLLTPQAWVGKYSYAGSDPAIFGEHLRAVTKRWAEQLRFLRGDHTAGFLLFANECWFAHSYDAKRVEPYPVVDGVKYGFAPIGLALDSGRRRFFSGEELATSLHVINDDESFRDLPAGEVVAAFMDASGKEIQSSPVVKTAALKYYDTTSIPLRLKMPETDNRQRVDLVLKLMGTDGKELGRTLDKIDVYPVAPEVSLAGSARVPVISGKDAVAALTTGSAVHSHLLGGGTAIVLNGGEEIVKMFPSDVRGATKSKGEFADWSPVAGTKLAEGLEPMDIKWWGRKDDWRVLVAIGSHRLIPEGKARELIRMIPAHGYTRPDKVPDVVQAALFEIPVGKGRLWVCNLDLEESVAIDPAARMLAKNILAAAEDPESTKNLTPLFTIAEISSRIGSDAKAGSYSERRP